MVFDRFSGPINAWSEEKNIGTNGRLAMLFYWEAQRAKTFKDLKYVRENNKLSEDTDLVRKSIKLVLTKKNVHIIILESFFDPSQLSGIKLSRPALHDRFLKLFGNDVGLSVSPVFGGGTAQAEFEVLTGVPAFEAFGNIEFNIFGGGETYSLPRILRSVGYRTVATNLYKPNFFNAEVAYQGLGFEKINFPRHYSASRETYLDLKNSGNEDAIFDGDLLNRNLEQMMQMKDSEPTMPILNYVVGMYGHYPFNIDYEKRPKVITVEAPTGFDVTLLERFSNQIYYRSLALVEYLEKLIYLDPSAVVIVLGDHLPNLEALGSMIYGNTIYKELGYLGGKDDAHFLTPIIILNAGRIVKLNNFAHYHITELVLDLLTDNDFCRYRQCFQSRESYRDQYLSVMAQAVKL